MWNHHFADFPALFQQFAGWLDAEVYKYALCKHEGLSARNIHETGSSAAKGPSCSVKQLLRENI